MTDSTTVVAEALTKLHSSRPELAAVLTKLVEVLADEASRTPRFADSLTAALTLAQPQTDAADLVAAPAPSAASAPAKRASSRRRAPGVIDPFAVYAETGESGLRDRLDGLDLEQLRDIIAEHGMDHDKLAMKWKTKTRVINRIVDKVSARSAKGSAFRAGAE